jgi:hypothetical protein
MVNTPDKRRACGVVETRTEMLTFGTACNALILSLRRVDDIDRRHYSGGRERYGVLRPGLFTFGDMAEAFSAWRTGERYVRGLGPACDALMATFFEMDTDGAAPSLPDDVAQIFGAILNVVVAADASLVVTRVGHPARLLMDQYLQNIEALVRAGLAITVQCTRP